MVNPISYQPQQAFSGGADFSQLANLGNVYREAQNRQKLSDLGKSLADGAVDYKQAAAQTADMGDINSTLKFLALAEQQGKEARGRAASLDFLTNTFRNPPQGAAETIAPPPSTRVNPAPGLVPNAADDSEDTPPRVPVTAAAGVVRTNPNGTIAGNLTAPQEPVAVPEAAAPPQIAVPPQTFANRFDAARPSGAAPAAPPAAPVAAPPVARVAQAADDTPTSQLRSMPQARTYVAAMLNPDLGEDQKKFAADMLKRELDNAKPNERIQFLDELSKGTAYEGKPGGRLEMELALRKSGATNIDQRTENAFAKTGGEVLAKRYGKISEIGDSADQDKVLLGQLGDLRQTFKTGGPAALQGWLADRGFKVGKNVSEIEAYNSIINKMTPEQRVPGSGATSDYEDKLFKSALPRLINSPGGNEIIDKTLGALADHKIERGRIANLALAGEISAKEANKRFQELSDPNSPNSPYAAFKTFGRAGFKDGAAPKSMTQDEYNKAPSGTAFLDPEGNTRTKP